MADRALGLVEGLGMALVVCKRTKASERTVRELKLVLAEIASLQGEDVLDRLRIHRIVKDC